MAYWCVCVCVCVGWDLEHKVSRSDVGVSRHLHTQHHHHRHHRSSTPPERETFSDLGIHGNNVRFHQVQKQTFLIVRATYVYAIHQVCLYSPIDFAM